jgi:hypothetical protein
VTTAIVAAETVVLVLLTILVAGLLRSHAEVLRRLHALGAGLDLDGTDANTVTLPTPTTIAGGGKTPDISGSGLADDAMHVAIGGVPHRTLLAFLSSGCVTCQEFWDAFHDVGALDLPSDMRVVIVAKDANEESISALRGLAPTGIPVVLSSAAWAAYDVPGSPYFVLVDGPARKVRGEGTGGTWPQVRNLMVQAAADAATRDSTEVRIDRELLTYGIEPGDESLYQTAEQMSGDARA